MSSKTDHPKIQDLGDFISCVVEAVEALCKRSENGVSRQCIIKYVAAVLGERKRSDKDMSPLVKSAIREALDYGLIVRTTGFGLNGSFALVKSPKRIISKDRTSSYKKTVVTKEAKLREIKSLASELHKHSANGRNISATRMLTPTKHQVSKRLYLSTGEMDCDKENQAEVADSSTVLKTILKPPSKTKVVKTKRKRASRKVKFCSPPRVVFFTPASTRKRSKRKK